MESVKQSAERLHTCLSTGKDKDETCLNIVITNPLNRRLEIAYTYETLYHYPLYEDLKKNLSGNFGKAIGYLFLSPLSLCCKNLKNSIHGFSTDDSCIFEVLSNKTVEQLKLIETEYKSQTGKDLKKELTNLYSGSLQKNIMNMFNTPRSVQEYPNKTECEKLANTLITAGESKWVEDDNLFREVFLKRSPEELVLIGRIYKKKTGNNLIDVVEKNVKGKNGVFLKEILYNNILPHELFAEKINLAIKGLGTDNNTLTRVLVSRSELDMPQIREIYRWKYNKEMKEDITKDTSGMYQKICTYLGEK